MCYIRTPHTFPAIHDRVPPRSLLFDGTSPPHTRTASLAVYSTIVRPVDLSRPSIYGSATRTRALFFLLFLIDITPARLRNKLRDVDVLYYIIIFRYTLYTRTYNNSCLFILFLFFYIIVRVVSRRFFAYLYAPHELTQTVLLLLFLFVKTLADILSTSRKRQ